MKAEHIFEPKIYINVSGFSEDEITHLFVTAMLKAQFRIYSRHGEIKALTLEDFQAAEGQITLDKMNNEAKKKEGMFVGN